MTTAAGDADKMTEPHPLKGIINTNDDPVACALCSAPAQTYLCYTTMICCGKDLCDACHPRRVGSVCPVCKLRPSGTYAATLKKHAKKGAPWAQFELGLAHGDGDGVRQSHEDANRWQEKAAKSGHPGATYNIGISFLLGRGRRMDLSKAAQYFRLALSRGASGTKCYSALVSVAKEYVNMKTPETSEEARSILLSCCFEEPNTHTADAHATLGRTYYGDEDYSAAHNQFVLSALASGEEDLVSIYAMTCKRILGHHAQGRFWLGKITMSKVAFENDEFRKLAITSVIACQRKLRQLRDTCGGCGAEFESKQRKFCRGCRSYCYCSRECQKMHWNRKENGHREDCLGLKDLKQRLKESKRNRGLTS